ncbi:MAG: transposase family protein [Crocinitomicaceae bacterium]|nr:transposase family protein [Crocinitomicaceae bacterium]
MKAIVPSHTSKSHPHHFKYPYLLRNLKIEKSNQVWATDITCIPMKTGYLYLSAIMDLHSRFIVGWSLSNTMEASWCTAVMKDAIARHGKPQIVNTDQGSQYTSSEHTELLKQMTSKFQWMEREEPLTIFLSNALENAQIRALKVQRLPQRY